MAVIVIALDLLVGRRSVVIIVINQILAEIVVVSLHRDIVQ